MAVFKCKECGGRFYSLVDCKAHLEAEHGEAGKDTCQVVRYRCPRCGLVYNHWADCKNHGMREHGILKPACEELAAETAPA